MSRALRVVGVAALIGLLGGCFWPAPGQNPDRTGHNPSETTLGPGNVGELTQRWAWDVGVANTGARAPVTSTAGVHVVTGDCRLATLDRNGSLAWALPLAYFDETGFDSCSFTTIGDPFVAGDRVWVGRQAVYIDQPPSPVTFENSSTVGVSFDGSSVEEWHGAMLDNLRRGVGHGVSGHIGSTLPPPPSFPIPVFYFIPSVAIGTLGESWRILDIPPDPASVSVPGRTLGATALYDAGGGTLATTPGDTTSGNGLRAYALEGAETGCGPSPGSWDCPTWATPLDGTNAWRPIVGDGGATLYVGTNAGTVYAVDAATGAVDWSASVGSAVTNSLALAGGTLFVPTASGDLVALAAAGCGAATCTPLWSAAAGGSVEHQPTVANGVVYTASADGSLHAFAAEGCGAATCPALWSDATGRRVTDAPIVSGGRLYVTVDTDPAAPTEGGGVLAYALP